MVMTGKTGQGYENAIALVKDVSVLEKDGRYADDLAQSSDTSESPIEPSLEPTSERAKQLTMPKNVLKIEKPRGRFRCGRCAIMLSNQSALK